MRRAAVLGTGVVGTATAHLLRGTGFEVSGEDPRPAALAGFPGRVLNDGDSDWDLIVIAVPTATVDGVTDTGPLLSAVRKAVSLANASRRPPLIAVRSTIMPGTMACLVAPALTGVQASLCYWPSFARERCAIADELAPRIVVLGTNDRDSVPSILGGWLGKLSCSVRLVTWEQAELAKVGANAFNALKISYFNALADWSREFGAAGQEVASIVALAAEGAWNPEYGTRVGPAFGGACLPKDLDAFRASLAAVDAPHIPLLEVVREVNNHPLRAPQAELA